MLLYVARSPSHFAEDVLRFGRFAFSVHVLCTVGVFGFWSCMCLPALLLIDRYVLRIPTGGRRSLLHTTERLPLYREREQRREQRGAVVGGGVL